MQPSTVQKLSTLLHTELLMLLTLVPDFNRYESCTYTLCVTILSRYGHYITKVQIARTAHFKLLLTQDHNNKMTRQDFGSKQIKYRFCKLSTNVNK